MIFLIFLFLFFSSAAFSCSDSEYYPGFRIDFCQSKADSDFFWGLAQYEDIQNCDVDICPEKKDIQYGDRGWKRCDVQWTSSSDYQTVFTVFPCDPKEKLKNQCPYGFLLCAEEKELSFFIIEWSTYFMLLFSLPLFVFVIFSALRA